MAYTPFTRYNRLSIRLYNQLDNRLHRVNGVLGCYTTGAISTEASQQLWYDKLVLRVGKTALTKQDSETEYQRLIRITATQLDKTYRYLSYTKHK